MKKQRLNLAQLEVKTFVTSVPSKSSETVKGGISEPETWFVTCVTDPHFCLSNNEDCETVFENECRDL